MQKISEEFFMKGRNYSSSYLNENTESKAVLSVKSKLHK